MLKQKTGITCEQFEEMCLHGELGDQKCELLDGEIVFLAPGGPEHSGVTGNAYFQIRTFVEKHHIGRVFTNETGIHTRQKPARTRGMDVAYISYKRLPKGKLPKGFFRIPPELIVEVLGEDCGWADMKVKVAEYHDMGVDMIWVADPARMTVTQFPRDGKENEIATTGVIEGGAILPGFKAKVASFFDTE